MSERFFDESAEDDLIHNRDYQAAAIGLLYSSLHLAMPSDTMRQPSFSEGQATAELVPPIDDEAEYPFYSVGIIVHPGDDKVVEGELLATVQICQEMKPQQDINGNYSTIDVIQEFRVFCTGGKYLVQKERILFDYDRGLSASLNDRAIADTQEITALNEIMDSWPVRSVEY